MTADIILLRPRSPNEADLANAWRLVGRLAPGDLGSASVETGPDGQGAIVIRLADVCYRITERAMEGRLDRN